MITHYDIIIVGAGVAGSAMAFSLASRPRPPHLPPLKVLLLERSLEFPSRIVGELLQPGGVHALRNMNLSSVLSEIDAVPMLGYCIIDPARQVQLPYPKDNAGRTFEHGKFVMALRRKAGECPNVELVEATVETLVECPVSGRILGVRAKRKGQESPEFFSGSITIVADGSTSRFRYVLGDRSRPIVQKSRFVGLLLRDAVLPISDHGTVVLVPSGGPVLLYRIGDYSTRMLVDLRGDQNIRDLKSYVHSKVLPLLPPDLRIVIAECLDTGRAKMMPNNMMPASMQGSRFQKEGVIVLGDAWNMRHPLTGAGMTVALSDTDILSNYLVKIPNLSDWPEVARYLSRWYLQRKPLSSTLNILSVVLYHLFEVEGNAADILRTGCFGYFELGGHCSGGTIALLAGLSPNPLKLLYHFFAVAIYGSFLLIYRLLGSITTPDEMLIFPIELLKATAIGFKALWIAVTIFAPPLWEEIRWW